MSKENVKLFFTELENNAELKARYLAAMQEHWQETEQVIVKKLIEVGSNAGFHFTDQDLRDTNTEIIDQRNANGELNDEDLAQASGGMTFKELGIFCTIISGGIGCAVVSLMAEYTKEFSRKCAEHLSFSGSKHCSESPS